MQSLPQTLREKVYFFVEGIMSLFLNIPACCIGSVVVKIIWLLVYRCIYTVHSHRNGLQSRSRFVDCNMNWYGWIIITCFSSDLFDIIPTISSIIILGLYAAINRISKYKLLTNWEPLRVKHCMTGSWKCSSSNGLLFTLISILCILNFDNRVSHPSSMLIEPYITLKYTLKTFNHLALKHNFLFISIIRFWITDNFLGRTSTDAFTI